MNKKRQISRMATLASVAVISCLTVAAGGTAARQAKLIPGVFVHNMARADRWITSLTFPARDPYRHVMAVLHSRVGRTLPLKLRARALTHQALFLYARSGTLGIRNQRRWRQAALPALHQAVNIDPSYAMAWLALATIYAPDFSARGRRKMANYLAQAARLVPRDPTVQDMRSDLIFEAHGGHGPGGRFTGNMGFSSSKWARAYCYRALMYMQYWRLHGMPARVGFWSQSANLVRSHEQFFTIALRYYEPKQLAAMRAGTWKPDPSADPWPPPEKKSAKTPATTQPGH